MKFSNSGFLNADMSVNVDKIQFQNMVLENVDFNKNRSLIQINALAKNKTLKLGISGNLLSNDDCYIYAINSFLFKQKDKAKPVVSKMAELRLWKKDNAIAVDIDNLKIGQGVLNLHALHRVNDLIFNVKFAKVNLYNLLEIKKIFKYNISKKIYGFGQCDLHTKNGILLGNLILDLHANDKKVSQIKSCFDENFFECKIRHEGGVDNFFADVKLPFYYSISDLKVHDSKTQKIFVDVSIKGALEKILLFDDNMTIKGNCVGNMIISGNKDNPKVDTNIKISQGLFEKDGVLFPNISIDLFSDDLNKIKIRKAIAIDSRGNKFTIYGGGSLVVDSGFPNIDCDMSMECKNFKIIDSVGLGVSITGKAIGSGRINKLNIKGNVDTNISYNIDEAFRQYNSQDFVKFHEVGNVAKDNKIAETIASLSPFVFDIDLNCKKLRVFGSAIDGVFSGKIKFLTFKGLLALDGMLSLKRGYINVAAKNINIKRGKLIFDKCNQFVPKVDILASSVFKNLLVFINVKSKDDLNMSIDISSTPQYSPEQILANIIFGRNMHDLKISEALRIKEAIKNITFKNDSKSILDVLKKLTFLNIGIHQEVNQSNRQETYAVNAGTYVTDKIYVGVKKNFEKENANVNIRVNVSPQVFVEGTSGGEVGVSWIKRY